jgi:low affinity Fe/Cu permease
MDRIFSRFASFTAEKAGHPLVFVAAFAIVVIWAVSGPVFAFSETWQLVINTGTTIITFLMVFIIQNSQNRDTRAVQIKLDELIRATEGADDSLIDLERLSVEEITRLQRRYCAIADRIKQLGLGVSEVSSGSRPGGSGPPAGQPEPAAGV